MKRQLSIYRRSGSFHFTEAAAAFILQKQRQHTFYRISRSSVSFHFTEAAAAFFYRCSGSIHFT
jgi:hypothetical protein